MTIDILMATFNGSKYIDSQLYSLLSQTYKDWKLYIHDDGSSDSTIEIIKAFQSLDCRIILIEDGIVGLGTAFNFLHLLKYSTSEFSIFCDQDDVWLENKIEEMLNAILRKNNTIPQAVYSNAYVYQESDSSIQGYSTLATPSTLKDLLFLNAGIQGCAILFNNKLRIICSNAPDNVCMHDHLLTLSAVTFGEFTYIDKRLMLYRRHINTVTGKTTSKKRNKIHDFFDREKTVLDRKHFDAVYSFYNKFSDQISIADKYTFNEYFAFPEKNRIRRIVLVIKNKFNIFNSVLLLTIKVFTRRAI